MAITKMKVVTLSTDYHGLDRMLHLLSTCDNFHVEEARKVLDEDKNGKVYEQNTQYMECLGRMESIMRSLHIDIPNTVSYAEEISLDEVEEKLALVESNFEKVNDQLMSMSHLKKEDVAAIKALHEFDFEEFHKSMFVSVNFGRLPVQNVEKLNAKENNKILYSTLHKSKQYHWILYECLWENQIEMEAYLKSLYFEPIAIPTIDDERVTEECKEIIDSVYGYLKFRGDIQKMNKYVAVYGKKYVVQGFVPASASECITNTFKDVTAIDIKLEDPKATDKVLPPTLLKNNKLVAPFELFVEMYGLPGYFDYDPTSIIAITYSILFGCMFGDLGQGLLLVIGGLVLSKWKGMKIGSIGARIGIFSMLFGIFYGSLFGNEEIIRELFHQWGVPFTPFHVMGAANIMPLLLSTVALGAVLIIISISINTIIKFRKGKIGEAIFHHNGLAGLVLYGSIAIGVVLQTMVGINVMQPMFLIPFVGIPVFLILFQHPFQSLVAGHGFTTHEGWGSYLMVSFFEVFEVALSFVSNTMSFMRVGGFVLSHAGMMLVVMILQSMAGPIGGVVVFILGTALVMALEGLVVGIQILRLEYYEMFSRYFEATGQKFMPVGNKTN